MQTNLENAIEIIKNLPVEDLNKLEREISKRKKSEQSSNGNKDDWDWRMKRYKKARKWLDENSEKYMNQWVCLEGDKLIAHSDDGREVYQKAKEAGVEIPFIHHIVEKPKFYYSGGYELIRD
jgi:hypothetical protein